MLRLTKLSPQPVQAENSLAPVPARHASQSLALPGGDQLARLVLGTLLSLSVLVAFLSHNTYDSGDSLGHYLFAHSVWHHPMNLLDSWAKPLFTLLAAVPAYFGFIGIELFQCGLVAASAWLSYTLARRLALPWPVLAIVFCYAAPDYFRIQFSGLTEPLFGLVLVGAVALAFADQPRWSVVLISWLPLVRSEGILLWGLWVVYLVWNRQWRVLPWLLLGCTVYSLVGGLVFGDFAWLVTHSPYAFHSPYGSGHWRHFIDHFPTLLGWPLALLFVVGAGYTMYRMLQLANWQLRLFRAEILLVNGTIVLFVLVQSLLWALGLFGSYGMLRVLTSLVPLCALVSLAGLGWLSAGRRWVLGAACLLVVATLFAHDHTFEVRPGEFMGHDANLHWRRDFAQPGDQRLAEAAAAWLQAHDPQWTWHHIAFEHPFYPIALKADMFDPNVRAPLTLNYARNLDGMPMGTYIFWEEWLAPNEGRLPLDVISSDTRFQKLWDKTLPQFENDPTGWQRRSIIFERVH